MPSSINSLFLLALLVFAGRVSDVVLTVFMFLLGAIDAEATLSEWLYKSLVPEAMSSESSANDPFRRLGVFSRSPVGVVGEELEKEDDGQPVKPAKSEGSGHAPG